MITIDDFKKLEIRIGEILSAEKVPETDKLIKLSVAMGDIDTETGVSIPRTIVSGIANHFPDPLVLVGKKCAFAANLAPRMLRGIESHGMILAVSGDNGSFSLLESSQDIPAGSTVK